MPPLEGKGLGITAPQPKFCTGSSSCQIPLPVLGPNPSSLNHRLPVTLIFQTALPEPAESQRVLVNFHGQGHSWRLGRAKCKVKNNFVNHSIICLLKYKCKVTSDTLMSADVCRGLGDMLQGFFQAIPSGDTANGLMMYTNSKYNLRHTYASDSFTQKQGETRVGEKPQL